MIRVGLGSFGVVTDITIQCVPDVYLLEVCLRLISQWQCFWSLAMHRNLSCNIDTMSRNCTRNVFMNIGTCAICGCPTPTQWLLWLSIKSKATQIEGNMKISPKLNVQSHHLILCWICTDKRQKTIKKSTNWWESTKDFFFNVLTKNGAVCRTAEMCNIGACADRC